MKPEFKLIENTNPATGEVSQQLQGKAILKNVSPMGTLKNSNDKPYTIGNISFEVNGSEQVHSAQIFEKTMSRVKAGDEVTIQASVANGNTYFRVIGLATAPLASADLFAELSQGLSAPVASEPLAVTN